MPITDFLIHNSQQYPDKVCLVEINPEQKETRKRSYKDYELISGGKSPGRFSMKRPTALPICF